MGCSGCGVLKIVVVSFLRHLGFLLSKERVVPPVAICWWRFWIPYGAFLLVSALVGQLIFLFLERRVRISFVSVSSEVDAQLVSRTTSITYSAFLEVSYLLPKKVIFGNNYTMMFGFF